MSEYAHEDIRDVWLRVTREAFDGFLKFNNPAEGIEPQVIINVYYEDGVGRAYALFSDDREKVIEGLGFVGLVGVAVNAKAITVTGKTAMSRLFQGERQSAEDFQVRFAAGEVDEITDALSAVTMYRDEHGERKVVAISRMVEGVVTMMLGKAEITDPDAPLFGGLMELMPAAQSNPMLQIAAHEYLVRNGAAEMERLMIHTSDISSGLKPIGGVLQ